VNTVRAWPKGHGRQSLPLEAGEYRFEYDEACRVLPESPKASAALTRRRLQKLLKKEAKTKADKLVDQLAKLSAGTLPDEFSGLIDAIRRFGNLAAHHDDRISDVEDHEAELCLDILEEVIDYYVVEPKLGTERIAKVNAQLTAAGIEPLQSAMQARCRIPEPVDRLYKTTHYHISALDHSSKVSVY
jgi:Domain of unknown function (DUF4145)